jgi:hypothetical protein
MTATQTQDDDRFDDEDDFGGQEPACMNCMGEGVVDSVAGESGRWDWDDEGPGICPNCNGSGSRKDQQWF